MTSQQFKIDGGLESVPTPIPIHGCGGRLRVAALLNVDIGKKYLDQVVVVCGWSKTTRKQGSKLAFIALNDGSSVANLQVVVQLGKFPEEIAAKIGQCGVATSFRLKGTLVKSPKEGQTYEMLIADPEIHEMRILGTCDSGKYPLAKKNHTREFLRDIQHLRPRSNLIGCVARIRSALIGATHKFFQERGFLNVHTPIITAADCEGAGEMFQVTTAIPNNNQIKDIATTKSGEIDYGKDFFGKKAYLTVSGQLAVETYACALSDVYTFGPTFRAEDSHTSRHLAEFWMIEPEMAFAELEDNMQCAESFLRYCIRSILESGLEDLKWLDANVEEGLIKRLRNIAESEFGRISYTEVITLLSGCAPDRFKVKPEWGIDLGSEHERYLAEEVFKKPVIVYDYPRELKAFYMKINEDGKTVRAMDILVPKIGEIVGGSERESDLETLRAQIELKGLDPSGYWWYEDLRRYGTVPHSGFGVGFERLIMLSTGVENIRDVIPFPRYPGAAEF